MLARIRASETLAPAGSLWIATRLALCVVSYLTLVNGAWLAGTPKQLFHTSELLQHWSRLDAEWYLGIAVGGYSGAAQSAFFPLFPALIRAVVACGVPPMIAGMAVANLGALAAFWVVGEIARQERGPEVVRPTLLAFASYPLAFFTFTVYPEGLFVAVMGGALLCARRGRWTGATVLAFFAGLTRPTAVALVLPLLWEFGQQHHWLRGVHGRQRWKLLARWGAVVSGVPLAVGGYALFLWSRFGEPLAFARVQRTNWGRYPVTPWGFLETVFRQLHHSHLLTFNDARCLTDLVPVAVVAGVIVVGFRRLPRAWWLYLVGILLVSITSPCRFGYDPFNAMGRHMMLALPVFFVFGGWMKRRFWLAAVVVATGFAAQVVLAGFFAGGGWIV